MKLKAAGSMITSIGKERGPAFPLGRPPCGREIHLLMETIRFALDQGYTRVSFGPLNNETKRRAATEVRPVVANLWTRVPFFRTFTRCRVIPNM